MQCQVSISRAVESKRHSSFFVNLILIFSSFTSFNCTADLNILRQKLYQDLEEHELECLNKLTFFVNPLSKQLEGMCDNCDYFCSL